MEKRQHGGAYSEVSRLRFASLEMTKCILIGILLFTQPATGKPPQPASAVQAPQEELVSIDFPEPIELLDLVKTISFWTNKNVILDSKALGKIQILGPRKVTKGEAYQAFLSALTSMGLCAVETGHILRIQARSQSQNGAYTPIADTAKVNYTDRVYTQIFPIKHMGAENLRNVLSFVIAAETLVTYAPSNSLILTETGFNLRKVAEIISLIDKPGAEGTYEFARITHVQASETAKRLMELFSGEMVKPGSPFKIVTDEAHNVLVLVGTPDQRRSVRKAIAEMDKALPPESQSDGGIFVRPLMFASAKKLASTLQAIGPSSRSASQNEEKLQITADEETNSLLFKGTSAAYRSMRGIVRRLDEAKPQVFLQCDIVAISESSNFNFLPSLIAGSGNRDGSGTKTIVGYQAEAMTPLILAQSNPTAVAENAKQVTAAFGNDLTVGMFPGGTVTIPGIGKISPGVLLRMMKSDTYGRTVSSPQLLAMDSEEASFTVGQTYNFLTSKVDSNGNTTQSVQKENADLTMKVTPTINNTDYLSLQIEVDSNTVQSFLAGGIPQIVKKKARQLVNFKNGQTILISGIRNLDRSESKTTIPFLGDIPLIGYLFNSKKVENRMDYTFIFVTAHIVRGQNDLQALYDKKFKDEDPHKALRARELNDGK